MIVLTCLDFTNHPLPLSLSVSLEAGRFDPITVEFNSQTWAFHLMMVFYLFFNVYIMVNVLIAIINTAFANADIKWHVIWHQTRLSYIERAQRVSKLLSQVWKYEYLGEAYSPREIYFSITPRQRREYEKRWKESDELVEFFDLHEDDGNDDDDDDEQGNKAMERGTGKEQEWIRTSLMNSEEEVEEEEVSSWERQDSGTNLSATLEVLMGRVQAAEAGLRRATEALVATKAEREKEALKAKEVALQWEDRIGALVEERLRQVLVGHSESIGSVRSLGVAEAKGSGGQGGGGGEAGEGF